MPLQKQDKGKEIEIVNPNKPPVHVTCPFMGNMPIMVQGGPHGQGRPEVLPIACQKDACIFWGSVAEKCKIEIFIDKAIGG